jgi:hypothetical protein
MRLACLYALLDLSPVIEAEHLKAALALWNYCEASAAAMFGSMSGDRVVDTILCALRGSPDGLSRTRIFGLFGNHVMKLEIETALENIRAGGLADSQPKPTGGRSAEIWKLKNVS